MSARSAFLAFVVVVAVVAGLLLMIGGSGNGPEVVVYTSVDTEFALPLFEKFTKSTGIRVVPRTDSEASKTTGLAERLMLLKDHPDGDVFWNSELSFTQVLAQQGLLDSYDSPSAADIPPEFKDAQKRWTAFGCRARVIIYNTALVKAEDVPRTLEGFSDPRWKGKTVIAKPLFGTTRSHLVALVLALREEKAFKLFRAWRENGITIAESNGDVRNRVAEGRFAFGLTDTDDVFSAMDRNKPVNFVVPGQTAELPAAVLTPNTVSMLKKCPHPEYAKKFIDFLLQPENERWLAEQGARQIPVRPGLGAALAPLFGKPAGTPLSAADFKPLQVDPEKLAEQVLPLGERIYRILNGETP